MYGAISGDIIGASYEFEGGNKTKNIDILMMMCGSKNNGN